MLLWTKLCKGLMNIHTRTCTHTRIVCVCMGAKTHTHTHCVCVRRTWVQKHMRTYIKLLYMSYLTVIKAKLKKLRYQGSARHFYNQKVIKSSVTKMTVFPVHPFTCRGKEGGGELTQTRRNVLFQLLKFNRISEISTSFLRLESSHFVSNLMREKCFVFTSAELYTTNIKVSSTNAFKFQVFIDIIPRISYSFTIN